MDVYKLGDVERGTGDEDRDGAIFLTLAAVEPAEAGRFAFADPGSGDLLRQYALLLQERLDRLDAALGKLHIVTGAAATACGAFQSDSERPCPCQEGNHIVEEPILMVSFHLRIIDIEVVE